jgi:hypothetical protein
MPKKIKTTEVNPYLMQHYADRVKALTSQLFDISYELDHIAQLYDMHPHDLYDFDELELTEWKLESLAKEGMEKIKERNAKENQKDTSKD